MGAGVRVWVLESKWTYIYICIYGGGGDFFLACEDFLRMLNIHSLPALFKKKNLYIHFFFLMWRLAYAL